ncbi:MAG: hypothetical protein M1830_010230, partial [Pleopsidium flavum]
LSSIYLPDGDFDPEPDVMPSPTPSNVFPPTIGGIEQDIHEKESDEGEEATSEGMLLSLPERRYPT